ncbi:MAG: type II secretion system protein [Candidatus Saccharimonadales bacterium]
MISLKNKSKGFTIVELLIVIVVIGILATLVIVTFAGIQQKARDTKRKTDVNALDSHIEAFYASTGNYPTYAQLTDATWRSTNMKGLDPQALVDPKGTSIANSNAVVGTFAYGYTAFHDDGTTACTSTALANDTACTKFTVSAALESAAVYQKQSN